jgi:hypothetical protein
VSVFIAQVGGDVERQAKASGRKRFFFEKKNQKTFANWRRLGLEGPEPKESKVSCFFFQRRSSAFPHRMHDAPCGQLIPRHNQKDDICMHIQPKLVKNS